MHKTTEWIGMARPVFLVVLSSLSLAGIALAGVGDLRITKVTPSANQVEITNTGTAFTASPWLCRRPNYLPLPGTWEAGQVRTIDVSLDNANADVWVYRDSSFQSSSSIIHGLRYGPDLPGSNRVSVAVAAGIWPSVDSFVPSPSSGNALVYDGSGFTPQDWSEAGAPAPTETPTTVEMPTETPTPLPPTETPTVEDSPTATVTARFTPKPVSFQDADVNEDGFVDMLDLLDLIRFWKQSAADQSP